MSLKLTVSTDSRLSVTDITESVADAIPDDAEGTVTVFVPHTTAGVTVNEGEQRLMGDIESALSQLLPDEGWGHDRIDDNADSHLRAMLVGESVTVPVSDGRLDMGTWQSILFVECDGPRTRTVRVVVE